MEIAHIQDVSISLETPATAAAWKKMTAGPA